MNRVLAVAAAPLLLTLAAAGPSLPIQPGKWQSTVTILDMQSPHLPAGAGAHASITKVRAGSELLSTLHRMAESASR